jgi:hypothetical protein
MAEPESVTKGGLSMKRRLTTAVATALGLVLVSTVVALAALPKKAACTSA